MAIYHDRRDVVVSERAFRQYYKRFAAQSFRQSVLKWREDMEAQFRAGVSAQLYAISYEDLLEDGRETLRTLLDYLGLEGSSDALEDMIERSSFSFRSGPNKERSTPL